MASHPQQPLVRDAYGVVRFKPNRIIQFLLESRMLDLNLLATLPFPDEDRIQLAQLIGYSVSGFGELSYVPDAVYDPIAAEERTMLDHHVEDIAVNGLQALNASQPQDTAQNVGIDTILGELHRGASYASARESAAAAIRQYLWDDGDVAACLRLVERVVSRIRSTTSPHPDDKDTEIAALRAQIDNFLTFGQGGANFATSQVLDRLSRTEAERDALRTVLEQIASRSDAEMANARTLHYDMRGWARQALGSLDPSQQTKEEDCV